MSLPDFIFTLQIDDDFICDDLMTYYERHNEYKQKGQSNGGDKISTDVVVYPNSTDPAILQYYGFLKYALEKYKEKYETLSFPLGFAEPFNIQHYEPGEGYFNWHCERGMTQTHQRGLVFMTYLNDVANGGQTQWLHQKKEVQPKKGTVCFFPAGFTHTHRGNAVYTHDKYIATGWYYLA